MSGGLNLFDAGLCNAYSPNSATNGGKGVSVTGGHNAYGAWTQLVASTAVDACWMCVRIWPTNNSSFRTFTSIGVGSSGNEIAIINDLYASSNTGGATFSEYWFPCSIPAGTSISAQSCQSAGTDANNVLVILYDGSFSQDGCAGVDSIGVTIGSSIATDIDPGATVNTKGAWTQLVASATRDYCGLIVSPGQNSTNNCSPTAPTLFDIAVGGSGSEQVLISDVGGFSFGNGNFTNGSPSLMPAQIPAGTRISARAQSANNTTGTRVMGLALYGVYQ
jgi:hypothetical protein